MATELEEARKQLHMLLAFWRARLDYFLCQDAAQCGRCDWRTLLCGMPSRGLPQPGLARLYLSVLAPLALQVEMEMETELDKANTNKIA